MNKPLLTYVGHSYHQITRSTAFLLELLATEYQLTTIWDDGWRPNGTPISAAQINQTQPDVVVFFQTLPALNQLKKIRCGRLFFVPMHDDVAGNPHIKWHKFRASGLRILNFCRATHDLFQNAGYESLCVQFWPIPTQDRASISGSRLFFWIRKREISWPTLKALLGEFRPDRIIMRIAPDPGELIDEPSPEDIDEYHIEIVKGWLEKAQYEQLLRSCQLFMAPRRFEGIGQSFLEAMATGQAVIAPNNPTMNEYIQHERSGYLYDCTLPSPLDFKNISTIQNEAFQSTEKGHQRWLASHATVLSYLRNDHATLRKKLRKQWWQLTGY